MVKFKYSIKFYFKYISKSFHTKIFNIGESIADVQKQIIKKGVCDEQHNSAGIHLIGKSEIQENIISI